MKTRTKNKLKKIHYFLENNEFEMSLEKKTIITDLRNELHSWRKKYPNVQIVAQHDIISLYNPAYRTYRLVKTDEPLHWFIYICSPTDIYFRKHITATQRDISNLISLV